MIKYIKESEAIEQIEQYRQPIAQMSKTWVRVIDVAINAVKLTPSADVVEVVRCKDCIYRDGPEDTCGNIYCRLHDGRFDKDGYCSYGKRREE